MNLLFVHCSMLLKGVIFFPYDQQQIRYEKYSRVHEKGEYITQQNILMWLKH